VHFVERWGAGVTEFREMKRIFWTAMIATIVVLIGSVGGAYYYYSAHTVRPLSDAWPQISWRAQIYLKKALGGIPGLSWAELLKMTTEEHGFGLRQVIEWGQSVDAALTGPYTSREDRQAGGQLFRDHCARCHGPDGRGAFGPSLAVLGYKNGDSEWAIYRVLTDGIARTAMLPTNLSFGDRWRVVNYLRTLQLHSDNADNEQTPLNIHATSEQIRTTSDNTGEWLSYSGSLSGWRYSSLSEITTTNVPQLRLRWVHQFTFSEPKFEPTPLVVSDTIFVTEPPATVVALDAKTGAVIWEYERPIPVDLPIETGRVNRGLAILDDSLFFGSLDGYLIAINANTGKVKWQTRVARSSAGYSLTGAPLIVNHSVVIGVAGGDFGARGFLAAYDVMTGQQQWKFQTIPEPGEAGHDTWQSEAWKTGGGGTWVTGSYDPSVDLIYWGVGNPTPAFTGEGRPGDNLFTDSVVALHASSGRLAWYFQFTPHDEHDWDSTQTPILADLLIDGLKRKVICWPNRNGFYYVLDRVTGEFLVGTPFVEVNWAQGLTSGGRPISAEAGIVTEGGRVTKPGEGGVNWEPAAFNPALGLIFVNAFESQSVFTKSTKDRVTRVEGGFFTGSGGTMLGTITQVVRALDAATGAKRWEYYAPRSAKTGRGGMLATGGGTVFGTSGGSLFALDAATGKELWSVGLGGDTRAPPISFISDGRQVIAALAGRAMFLFGL
jgi:alcohol dehydrogenase (cytochrome c)